MRRGWVRREGRESSKLTLKPPQRVRLYVNRPNGLDFESLADEPPSTSPATGTPNSGLPQADFLLREQDATVANAEDRIQEYPLARFAARFTSVQSIHVVLVSRRAGRLYAP